VLLRRKAPPSRVLIGPRKKAQLLAMGAGTDPSGVATAPPGGRWRFVLGSSAMRTAASCIVVAMLLALAGPRSAGADTRYREARRHVARANRDYDRGDYRDALARYQRAYKLVSNPDIVVAIGKCHAALHEWDRAVESFSEYLQRVERSSDRGGVQKLLAHAKTEAARARRPERRDEDEDEDEGEDEVVIVEDKPRVRTGIAVARAGDPPEGATPSAALDVREGTAPVVAEGIGITPAAGMFVNFALPGSNSLYTYGGATLDIPRGQLTWSPELLAQWSPDGKVWGLVTGLTADISLSERFGIDLTFEIGEEQAGVDLGNAQYFTGAGVGVAIFAGRWTFTPFTGLQRGINYDGWDATLGFGVACGL